MYKKNILSILMLVFLAQMVILSGCHSIGGTGDEAQSNSTIDENNEKPSDDFPLTPKPESYFVTAGDEYRIFVRKEADIQSDIILSIESGDKGIRLKDMGERKSVDSYIWYKIQLPDGGTGWVREDVVIPEGEQMLFQVETDIRYYHLEKDYDFVFSDDYIVTGDIKIQFRVPLVSASTPDAAIINAKINEDVTQYIRPLYEKFVINDFSPIKKQGPDQISRISVNYEVYHYNNLFALAIEEWYELVAAGVNYSCNVYYYDGKTEKMIDAETYATLAGFTKEDIILAENNNPTYYQVDTFEQVKFYIKNDGTLHTTVDFSD